jgi:DNA-binding transcriptional LysR family regulator
MEQYEPPPVPVHAVWPPTRVLPARTQLFVDFLADQLGKALL